ncbi:MAG: hypothetical protein V4621_07835 [Pseudomonadota bacterium]
MAHGPIEEEHRALMNDVAQALKEVLDPLGFALLVFEKGDKAGRMNYICNCDRDDMVTAMKEFIANHEGRTPPSTTTPQ